MIDVRLNIPTLEADFEAVVDSIRKTGIITDSVVSGNSTILTTVNTLKVNQVLLIDGKDCRIDEASPTEITVNQTVGGASEWKALFPYFMDGHIVEIAKRLSEKDKSNNNVIAYTKYPLVVLLQDIEYDKNKINPSKAVIDFIIVNGTEQEYITIERRDNNFTPILDPIYNELIGALRDNSTFRISNDDFSVSRKYFWGAIPDDKNPFDDRLDAIEVNNLNLSLITQNC